MLWLAWHSLGAGELEVLSVRIPEPVFVVWGPLRVVVHVPGSAGTRREVVFHVGEF